MLTKKYDSESSLVPDALPVIVTRETRTTSSRVVQVALLALLILVVNAALNAVLFLPGERIYRGSIEPGYVSMARFAAEHPNPWGWKPEQYCGLPAQFAYLPGLPYVTALWIRLLHGIEPEQIYRVLTVTIACLGPVTVFLFGLYFMKSRWWALAAALTYTVFSPTYVLSTGLRLDAGIAQLPSRLHAQIKYGEAPHNAGLMLLPLALIALYAAGRQKRYWQVFAAAVLVAAIALTNWVAMLALAWCCLMLVWSASRAPTLEKYGMRWIIGALCLAYLFAAFWLTPDFIETTVLNWPADAFGYVFNTQARVILFVLLLGMLLLRALVDRAGAGFYLTFLSLCFFSFTFLVMVYYWFSFDAIPEARRYAPEADLFAVLLYFELARRACASNKRVWRDAAIGFAALAALLGAPQVWRYATKPFHELRPVPKETTAEYRVAQFLAAAKPQGRVFVTGSTRYHLNSWFNVPQVEGTFDTGLKNRAPLHFRYQIRTGEGNAPGEEGRTGVMQLKAMSVEYIAVHGADSKEFYRDLRNPTKFDGLLERVYHQDGDSIYRVPFTSYAHLVRKEEIPAALPVGGNVKLIEPYAAAIDDASRPKLRSTWQGASELLLEGPVPKGMLVAVNVSYDPGWIAMQDGQRLPTEQDAMGFIVLNPIPAQSARILLRYRGTLEQKAFAALSLSAWVAAFAVLFVRRNRHRMGCDDNRSPH